MQSPPPITSPMWKTFRMRTTPGPPPLAGPAPAPTPSSWIATTMPHAPSAPTPTPAMPRGLHATPPPPPQSRQFLWDCTQPSPTPQSRRLFRDCTRSSHHPSSSPRRSLPHAASLLPSSTQRKPPPKRPSRDLSWNLVPLRVACSPPQRRLRLPGPSRPHQPPCIQGRRVRPCGAGREFRRPPHCMQTRTHQLHPEVPRNEQGRGGRRHHAFTACSRRGER